MEKELDIKKVFSILKRKTVLILTFTISFGLIAYIISAYLITPQYSATATMYVYSSSVRNDNITSSDLATSQQLVQTYIVILKSNSVLNDVAEKLGGVFEAEEIREMMNAEAIDNTEAFKVTITNKDPIMAQKIVNTIVNVAPHEIIRVVKAGAVEVIDNASLPVRPASPNIARNTAVGAFIGLLISIIYAIVVAMFDTVVHSEEDLTTAFNIPILGVIPKINFNEGERENK